MSRLKIEHGASKTHWVLLKTTLEEQLSEDIDALCRWSENDRRYVVNELLRFAIAQAEEFQKHKAGLAADAPSNARDVEIVSVRNQPASAPAIKTDIPAVSISTQHSKEEPSHAS